MRQPGKAQVRNLAAANDASKGSGVEVACGERGQHMAMAVGRACVGALGRRASDIVASIGDLERELSCSEASSWGQSTSLVVSLMVSGS